MRLAIHSVTPVATRGQPFIHSFICTDLARAPWTTKTARSNIAHFGGQRVHSAETGTMQAQTHRSLGHSRDIACAETDTMQVQTHR
jgi:hypothetical protein